MQTPFYRYEAAERRRLLADTGFVRQRDRTWSHPDGRSIGEGVAIALADDAFFRFIGVERPETGPPETGPDFESEPQAAGLSDLSN
ncbi:MAG: hypothetical protein ACOYLF_15090 [Blastocatellia bacterium]|jgi:hypothetical protein